MINNNYHGKSRKTVCSNASEPHTKRMKAEPTKDELIALPLGANGVCDYRTTFKNRLKSYFIRCENCLDLSSYLMQARKIMVELVRKEQEKTGTLKINLAVDCMFYNIHSEKCEGMLKTRNSVITKETVRRPRLGSGDGGWWKCDGEW